MIDQANEAEQDVQTVTDQNPRPSFALQREHLDVRCRRLMFRCWHRGTKEGDLILGRFAETHLADFNVAQIEQFEALLDCTDPDLFDWIVIGIAPPSEYQHDVMYRLRAFARHQRQAPQTIPTIQE